MFAHLSVSQTEGHCKLKRVELFYLKLPPLISLLGMYLGSEIQRQKKNKNRMHITQVITA